MSGFLSRLGARQTGKPVIRPRALSRFESGDVSTASFRSEPALSNDAGSMFASESQRANGAGGEIGPPGTVSSITQSRALRPDDFETRIHDLLNSETRPLSALSPMERSSVHSANTASGEKPASSASTHDVPIGVNNVITNIASVVDAALRAAPLRAGSLRDAALLRDAARATHDATPREPDVVHVHIGRVEVRAVHAPPERTRTRTQNTTETTRSLSLENYLGAQKLP